VAVVASPARRRRGAVHDQHDLAAREVRVRARARRQVAERSAVRGLVKLRDLPGHGGALDRTLSVLLAALPLKQAAALAAKLTGARDNEAYKRALHLKGN
jgi:hypothetical protein